MSDFDTDAFLIVAILGLAFAAFELAGERLKGFHTLSYWSSVHIILRWFIVALFLVGGIVGAIWFSNHACTGCIER